jgi:hypothetical protein
VAHLQAAQSGYDSLFKMGCWDVSQNADRFKAELGILPCITPGGSDFAPHLQHALSGSQLLLLQGMPMNKLMFARETQRDCQDLAGNAMSTTVIGASLVSAVISGAHRFRLSSPVDAPLSRSDTLSASSDMKAIRPSLMKRIVCVVNAPEQLNLKLLRKDALMSARLCNCEGDNRISEALVHICSVCGHTACAQCAGLPRHEYADTITRDQRLVTPNQFVHQWRAKLPHRLKFMAFPKIRPLVAPFQPLEDQTASFIDHLEEARISKHHFCIQDVLRQDAKWKIVYRSHQARLELRIGRVLEWLLFLDCPSGLPGNSPLRKLFGHPIAQAEVTQSLLHVDWKVHLPIARSYKLQVRGSSSKARSWRSRIGLPDYRDETVPTSLHIRSRSADSEFLAGDFHLEAQCGTACESLYKRVVDPELYLFLDPDLIGKSKDDAFVFADDCGRKQYGDPRIPSACVDTLWRPWAIKGQDPHEVGITLPGIWHPATIALEFAEVACTVSIPVDGKSFAKAQIDCLHDVIVLEADFTEVLPLSGVNEYSWALEHAKTLPTFSSWQPFPSKSSGCSCAPKYPPILWRVNEKGVATPHEDQQGAASFERDIKKRPPVLRIQARAGIATTGIEIAINIASLVHRAVGHLSSQRQASTSWRLLTDHATLAPIRYPPFRLLSNANDAPATLTKANAYLKHAQPRSLAWMKTQEQGRTLKITEVEEAVEPNLGWRVEAQAHVHLTVRGGVLADLPSFTGRHCPKQSTARRRPPTPHRLLRDSDSLSAAHGIAVERRTEEVLGVEIVQHLQRAARGKLRPALAADN